MSITFEEREKERRREERGSKVYAFDFLRLVFLQRKTWTYLLSLFLSFRPMKNNNKRRFGSEESFYKMLCILLCTKQSLYKTQREREKKLDGNPMLFLLIIINNNNVIRGVCCIYVYKVYFENLSGDFALKILCDCVRPFN